MAEQDINTCCVEGRSPASLCSRFTIWELGQLLWGGALGSLRDLALHARARAPGTVTRRVAGLSGWSGLFRLSGYSRFFRYRTKETKETKETK